MSLRCYPQDVSKKFDLKIIPFEDDKKDINDKVDALKEALKGEDINLIKSRQEELTSKFYEISEKVYKAAAEQAQAQQGADGAQPGSDAGYTEANYTDVPEDND